MPSRKLSIDEYEAERRKLEDEGRNSDEGFLIITKEGRITAVYKFEEKEDEEEDEEKKYVLAYEAERARSKKFKEDSGIKDVRITKETDFYKFEEEEKKKEQKIRDIEEKEYILAYETEKAGLEKLREDRRIKDARIAREDAIRRKENLKLIYRSSGKEDIITEMERKKRIKFKSSKEYQSSDDEIMSYIKIYLERRPGTIDMGRIEDKKVLELIRKAIRDGCETDKEIFDFIKNRRIPKRPQMEFAPAVKRLIPKLEDEFDRRYEAGEELVIEIPVECFLLEMGEGKKMYLDLGYSKVLSHIRKTLQYEGINVRYIEKTVDNDIEQYFTFWAITEEEARNIEEKDNNIQRKKTCRRMAKKVCKNKIHNEDDNSIWKDVDFIKNLSECSFDVNKIEEKVKKGKESLFNERIENGFGLLFE